MRTAHLLFAVIVAVGLLLSFETASRLYWTIRGISFWQQNRIILNFYPELRPLLAQPAEPGSFDILLLGGSVLNPEFGRIEAEVRRGLSEQLRRPVRSYNLAQPAHTSRDSLIKYSALERRRFSLVVVYHSINELRANNCPADFFRADYSHFFWYRLINPLQRYHFGGYLSFPYTAAFGWSHLLLRLNLAETLPPELPNRPEWLRHGSQIKTAPSFRENLQGIVRLAAERREPLVLMTFAWHIPADYSEAAFERRELDYGIFGYPVRLWGDWRSVRKGLEAHNQVIREIASGENGLLFVDQQHLMPQSGKYFGDACHFTDSGSLLFAQNIVERLASYPQRLED